VKTLELTIRYLFNVDLLNNQLNNYL